MDGCRLHRAVVKCRFETSVYWKSEAIRSVALKHLNPLRTLRLLTALSAASSPVYVPLFVGIATPMVSTSTVVAQSPPGGSLPPIPPAAQAFASLPSAAPAVPGVEVLAKELLGKAQAALKEGRKEVALKTLAQAQLVGPATAEWNAEVQKTRKQFEAMGVTPAVMDNAFIMAQQAMPNQLRSNGTMLPPLGLPVAANNTTAPNNALPTLPPLPGTVPSLQTLTPNPLRDQAVSLTAQAKFAMDRGDVAGARRMIDQAIALKVPDKDFGSSQTRPWEVELAISSKEKLTGNIMQASASMPSMQTGVQNAGGASPAQTNSVQNSLFQPKSDSTKVAPASGVLSSFDAEVSGQDLYRQGVSELTAGNKKEAMEKFRAAYAKRSDLDQATVSQLKDKLTQLEPRSSGEPESISALSAEGRESQIKRQRLFSEVSGEIADAERMAMANKPLEALDKLRTLRNRITQSDVDSNYRKSMFTMVDKVSGNIEAWVEQNKVAIQLDQRNKQIEDRMDIEAQSKAKSDLQVQTLVDQYNDLIDQRRFEEAIEVAKRVSELKPGSEIAAVMMTKARAQARIEEYELIRGLKEENFMRIMLNTEMSSTPFDDNRPFAFPSVKEWTDLSERRLKDKTDSKILPSEKKIREALDEPFSASFDKRPLSEAMRTIGEMFGVPVDIDQRSIEEEGVTVDTPVTLDLQGNSIRLKSALNQILEKLNLTYAVKNETLTIQSRRFTQRELQTKTYNVKDLVIPIPNFVSDNNTGMAGALQAAFQAQTSFASATVRPQESTLTASRMASIDPKSSVMAQIAAMPNLTGVSPSLAAAMPGAGLSAYANASEGLGGGGAMANYGELINLIQQTITPDAWDIGGGTSTMLEFRQNLSLVVSAPQETHEAIADLLKSLRSLGDLQVTIEVKFIQLQDTFFEQIGVDFDVKFDDNVRQIPRDDQGPSVAVGLSSGLGSGAPTFTSDLDLTLSNNFTVTPPFGAPDIGQATTFGMAILSDMELFFFLQASQGNSRQNVLNAPKVTMYDGQTASINDTAQRPFVTSFQPVVGDFAVAQQPIIVVLNEGTMLNVQSVVSQDKRFVRMTLNPQFTRIESADRQFTFQGRRSTRTGTVTSILNPNGSRIRDDEEEVTEGTTVQQPTFGTTNISTTVNVPDGGTILLGGIKRLQEGRTERGTPILSKIPYLSRLFKNNAIGRTTNTLMMTVTPRIIIPEEEEELLGVSAARP